MAQAYLAMGGDTRGRWVWCGCTHKTRERAETCKRRMKREGYTSTRIVASARAQRVEDAKAVATPPAPVSQE